MLRRHHYLVVCWIASISLLALAALSVFLTWSTRETFVGTDQAYVMLDDRCYINMNVVAAAGLGIVRHPTSSLPGVCVVRGDALTVGGVCDPDLFDERYASSFRNENVQGKQECVLRMIPGLSDSDAQAYADILLEDTVQDSTEFQLLQAELATCQGAVATLGTSLEAANKLQSQTQASLDQANSDNVACNAQVAADVVTTNTLQSQLTDETNKYNACEARLAATPAVPASLAPPKKPSYVAIDGNLPYHDYAGSQSRTSTAAACQDKCTADANTPCTHYAWDNRNGTCYLKSGGISAAGEYGSQDGGGFTSGIARSLASPPDAANETGYVAVDGNLPYHDYAGSQTTASSAADCEAKCTADSSTPCTHYAWDTRGDGTCYLKSGGISAAGEYGSQGGGFTSGIAVSRV